VKVGFGTAIVGGGVALLAGLGALNKKSQLDTECNPSHQCDSSQGGSADLSTARTYATVADVGFAVGVVGAVFGVIGLLSSKSHADVHDEALLSPWIGAGAAGLHGRF
jgi:hypothetical protein